LAFWAFWAFFDWGPGAVGMLGEDGDGSWEPTVVNRGVAVGTVCTVLTVYYEEVWQ
jgi:hypothetical protein